MTLMLQKMAASDLLNPQQYTCFFIILEEDGRKEIPMIQDSKLGHHPVLSHCQWRNLSTNKLWRCEWERERERALNTCFLSVSIHCLRSMALWLLQPAFHLTRATSLLHCFDFHARCPTFPIPPVLQLGSRFFLYRSIMQCMRSTSLLLKRYIVA